VTVSEVAGGVLAGCSWISIQWERGKVWHQFDGRQFPDWGWDETVVPLSHGAGARRKGRQ
jgi:hypothetical protein